MELADTSAPLVSSEMEQVNFSELSAVPESKRVLTLYKNRLAGIVMHVYSTYKA